MGRILWLVGASIACLGLVSGCSDNADALAAARASKKTPARSPTANPDGETLPTTTPGTTNVPTPQTQGGACTPTSTGTPEVVWRPPHRQQGACTQQEAAAIATCFFNNQNCDQPVTANCHTCAVSSPTASQTFGAIIVDETGQREPEVNVEGCVAAMTNDTSASGCGARLKMTYACESAACSRCDAQGLAACQRAAATGPCAQYAQQSAQCESVASQCMAGTTEAEVAMNLIQLFCM